MRAAALSFADRMGLPHCTGKLHRALRLSTEHIPDSKLGDIKEADDEVGADANSDSDASREVQLDQPDGGLASDDTDLEPFSECSSHWLHQARAAGASDSPDHLHSFDL